MDVMLQSFPLSFSTKRLFYWSFALLLMGQAKMVVAENVQLASAQDLLELSLEELFNIPITSTSYFPETYLDVAASVSVIQKQDWEKRGAQRLSDAFQNLPSVISLPNFFGQSSTRIRGYAFGDARGISTLWDGVPINVFASGTADIDRSNIQLNTLDSIEVTRGPGSALYGADSFHGVVALKSFDSDVDTNNVMGRIGSRGFYSAGYNGSHKLGSDSRLNISLSSSAQPDQDIKYNNAGGSGEREYNYQSTTFVAKFASKPREKWSYRIGLYYDDNESNNFNGGNSFGTVPNNDTSSTNSDFSMFKGDVTYQISKQRDISLEAYLWEQSKNNLRPVNSIRDLRISGQEMRKEAKLVYRDKTLAGNTELTAAFARREEHIISQRRTIFDATTTFVNAELPSTGLKRTISSFFVDGKTQLSESRWIYRYGFRLDDYSDFGTQFTPRLGVIYRLEKKTVLKALYGSSFRAPTAVEIAGTAFINGDPNIHPEELNTYELIYLRQEKNTKYEFTVFHNKLTNGIVNVAGTFTNISESEADGLEIGFTKKLQKWLIEASGSYVKSRDLTNKLAYKAFPKYILNLGVGYVFSNGWSVNVNNRVHLDAYDIPALTAVKLKDYWRMDLNVTKSLKEKMQLFVNIRNVLDRDNNLPSLIDQAGGIPEVGIAIDMGIKYQI